MRVCPKCNKTYTDKNLNFCLADGEMLMEVDTNDAQPTMILDNPRVTNPGFSDVGEDPNFGAQDQNFGMPQQNPTNQQIYQQPYNSPATVASKDQTLPMIAIITGALSVVLSLCCYLGVFIGPIALITGFIGMNNANKNPEVYEGKNLAIAGMIAGGVGLGVSILMLLLVFISAALG